MTKDNLNQVGIGLGNNSRRSNRALKKEKPIKPQIERARDTMDFEIPFEFEFYIRREEKRILLDLNFLGPPKTGCCANCECSICEFFDGGITETLYQTTYAYIAGTAHAFKEDGGEVTFIEETDPQRGLVTVWAHNTDRLIICYVYDTCVTGGI